MRQLVDSQWLVNRLSDTHLRILDCHVMFERADGELKVESGRPLWEQGHIPGSAHVDLIDELSDPTSEYQFMMPSSQQVADVMSRLGIGEGTEVVLYDRDKNMWAARVWWILRAVGFDDAAVLNGGWRSWTLGGRPVSTDAPPEHPPCDFVMRPRPNVFVSKEQVSEAIDADDICLVNALGESEHRGESANYGRRGHIPSAVNVPAATLVDPNSHLYLDEAKLRSRMEPVYDSLSSRAITYCGGGISASSDAFVLDMLGWEQVAIYDASMSEWGADPSLPLTLEDA